MIAIMRYCVLVVFVGFGSVVAESTTEDKKPLVLVSVPPYKYFVRGIAGDSVDVRSVVPADVSPETYEPKPSQVAEFMRAAAFFGVGMGYESILYNRIASTHNAMRYINLTHEVLTHAADSSQHAHDPHIWLSLEFAKPQAQMIYNNLCAINPAYKKMYAKNLNALFARIDAIQRDLTRILADQKGRAFVVIHPAFGYLAREFGLEEIALEENGKEIKLKALNDLPNLVRQKHIRTLFIQPQFDKARAESIASMLQLRVDILDSLDEHWEDSLYTFAHKIKAQ